MPLHVNWLTDLGLGPHWEEVQSGWVLGCGSPEVVVAGEEERESCLG